MADMYQLDQYRELMNMLEYGNMQKLFPVHHCNLKVIKKDNKGNSTFMADRCKQTALQRGGMPKNKNIYETHTHVFRPKDIELDGISYIKEWLTKK